MIYLDKSDNFFDQKFEIMALGDAIQLFNSHQFNECRDLCTELLVKNPYDQAVWLLKVRSITELSRQDDSLDNYDAPPPDNYLDDSAAGRTPLPRYMLAKI
jgi:tetratricopeptide repeat protein 8